MSISIKLMGVPGAKLMDEEQHTLDMFGVSTPTFVTPDTRANAHLQTWSLKNASIFHFVNFKRPHVLDLIMQALFIKTQSSPFEAPYFSCVPYLLGEGQAMQYSVWPKTKQRTPIPRLPRRPPDDYLRDAMVAALAEGDVEFDIRLQLQTDPHSDADREQRRAVAGEAFAARDGRHAAPAQTEVRLAGADGIRQEAFLQPVAHHRRASPAGQPEPRPAAHVFRVVQAAAYVERGAALRAAAATRSSMRNAP